MNKLAAFFVKYGVYFNVFSIAFWIVLLYINYQRFQQEPDASKMPLIICVVFLGLSVFNLSVALKKRKQQKN